ncbi:hypothetical protein [Roseomonas chloroacetimidivorans]|uniref:hypothetical protein n=1 Tax=Roseomonas chloroacetimidivorans TaxID=1766656 RepID=UPI003C760C8E
MDARAQRQRLARHCVGAGIEAATIRHAPPRQPGGINGSATPLRRGGTVMARRAATPSAQDTRLLARGTHMVRRRPRLMARGPRLMLPAALRLRRSISAGAGHGGRPIQAPETQRHAKQSGRP